MNTYHTVSTGAATSHIPSAGHVGSSFSTLSTLLVFSRRLPTGWDVASPWVLFCASLMTRSVGHLCVYRSSVLLGEPAFHALVYLAVKHSLYSGVRYVIRQCVRSTFSIPLLMASFEAQGFLISRKSTLAFSYCRLVWSRSNPATWALVPRFLLNTGHFNKSIPLW